MTRSEHDVVRGLSKSSTKANADAAREAKAYEFLIAGIPYRLKTNHDDATVQELVGLSTRKWKNR